MRVQSSVVMLLALCLVFVVFPQPVMSAHDGVCIRADGSIDGTSSIQRDGDVYTFTDNLYDVILLVENDNVVIDGAGYILYGDGQIHGPTEAGGMGVELVECNNVTIKNLTIKKFTRGIRLTNSFDCNVYQNTLTNNSIGIELGGVDKSYIDSYASNNTVSGNVIKENNTGIRLNLGSSNTVCENTITKNNYGICILGASENSIIYNHITNNQKGVYFEISGINIFHHNNFDNNINDCWDYGLTPWCFQLPFSVNIWDDGKEGNYWNNYNGTDNNGDDIGDEPYVIDEKNQDNYPLLTPVTIETIPEFSSLTLLFVLLVAVVAVTVNYKRKLQQRSRHK